MPKRFILTEEKTKYTYFAIHFEYDPEIVDRVKKIPSASFHGGKKVWYARVSNESAPHIFELVSDYEFEATQEVLDMVKNIIQQKQKLLRNSRADDADIDLPDFPLKPYPFQKAGVKYMLTAKKCFNGDDMGLGKTIQAIIAMETAEAYPHIVICPAGVKKKWRKEIKKWVPHRSSAILDDLNFSYHHDIMILNYEVVLKYLVREERRSDKKNRYFTREQIKRIDLKGVTVDESHYVKNNTSKRTKAVRQLCKGVEYVWLLSGTIIENRPKELITQLQIMNRLNDFGGYNNFIRRYCDAEMEWHGHMNTDGASNLNELNKKLRQTCFIRRKKSDILDELPSKSRTNIQVRIDNRDEYELAENNIFDWMEQERKKRMGNTLDFGDQDDKPKREFVESAIELQIINALKMITARGKLEKAKEWITKFLKTGNKLVVFANHIEIQKEILKEFPSAARILGGMSPSEKDKNNTIFQEREACQLIVCSQKAANMGIDLTASHHMLHTELAWTPSVHDQCEDRSWRLGQFHDCYNYYLLGRNTIDEDIYDLLQTKREVTDASLDGAEEGQDTSILDDLIKRLKEKNKLNIPEEYEPSKR